MDQQEVEESMNHGNAMDEVFRLRTDLAATQELVCELEGNIKACEQELLESEANNNRMRVALDKVTAWLVANTDIVEHNPLLDDVVIPATLESPSESLTEFLQPTIQTLEKISKFFINKDGMVDGRAVELAQEALDELKKYVQPPR